MKGEWCYWNNYVTADICDQVISYALKLEQQMPTLGYDSGSQNENFRRSRVRWIDVNVNPEFTFIYDLMWKALIKINQDWFSFNVTSLPPMQFTEYEESYQGEYQLHQDVFWVNGGSTHRKISLVLQLSDPANYEGGNLMFEKVGSEPSNADYEAMRARGTIVAFPSFVYHKLTPVTRGKRYSLVAWFEGPKFQ
jgi:PKHD-type hydroxylase